MPMTHTQLVAKLTNKKTEYFQTAYDRGFCKALENDVSLDDACSAGLIAELGFAIRLSELEPED